MGAATDTEPTHLVPQSGQGQTHWHIPPAPKDPILTLHQLYLQDTHPSATNLSIGAYRTATGKQHEFQAVTDAQKLLSTHPPDHAYLPLSGHKALRHATTELIYGSDPALHSRIALIHTVSGSGALRLALAFCARILHSRVALVADPTWPNHIHLAAAESFNVIRYSYYNTLTKSLNFQALLADLRAAPFAAVVLLQACAHNPTGCDLSQVQWRTVASVVKERSLIPIFDMAYQGLATGDVANDAYPIRLFVTQGLNVFVAQSFSKNMGLYNSRVGTVSLCLSPGLRAPQLAANAVSQLCWLARATYSSPPVEGARIAATILTDELLRERWKAELREMVRRMQHMRKRLREELQRFSLERDWMFLENKCGMFVCLGLQEGMVERLRTYHHVYVTGNSRVNVAGLTEENVVRVAESVAEVIAHAHFVLETTRME